MSDYKLVPVELIEHVRHARRELTRHEVSPMHVRQRLAQKITDLLAAAPAVQGEPVAHTFYVLHDSTEGQKYIKKDIDDGCLAIFEREEDARRAKRRHSGTDYTRVDYYTAPLPAEQQPDVAQLVEALEAAQKEAVRGINHARNGAQAAAALGRVSAIVGAALAAHRKEPSHDNQ